MTNKKYHYVIYKTKRGNRPIGKPERCYCSKGHDHVVRIDG